MNEILAVYLLAKKFGVPVCPHAGGVGLCELVQHLSIFDYVAVSGSLDSRVTEYVDHLHEHFVDPCIVENGAYRVPTAPGYSAEMYESSFASTRTRSERTGPTRLWPRRRHDLHADGITMVAR